MFAGKDLTVKLIVDKSLPALVFGGVEIVEATTMSFCLSNARLTRSAASSQWNVFGFN